MTLQQAIANVRDVQIGWWFRPVSWRGCGQGYCIKAGRIYHVPSLRGGEPAHFPSPEDVLGEWEVVFPADVNAETSELMRGGR